jgi:hypothetical protein
MTGIPNLGGTCYLNALVQALYPLTEILVQSPIIDAIRTLDTQKIIDLTGLPKSPHCAYEAFHILNLDLSPFKFTLLIDGKKEVFYEYLGENIHYHVDELGREIILKKNPKILLVIKGSNSELSNFDIKNYELISFIDFLGGHYICCSKRDGIFHTFNDSNVSSPIEPNTKSFMLFYVLV